MGEQAEIRGLAQIKIVLARYHSFVPNFELVLATKRWCAKVIVIARCSLGNVTAGCRAPTHPYYPHTYLPTWVLTTPLG